jgi:hypothetical protein
MNRCGHSLWFLLLLGLLAGGCNTNQPTNIRFRPSGNGPLSSIKPLTVRVQVEDQRPPADQDCVFRIVADVGGTESWYSKKPVPLIVQDALVSEFSKCGHRPVTDTSTTTDASVKVVLTRFRGFLTTSGGPKVDAHVDAEVLVVSERRKVPTPPFRISGDYQRGLGRFRNPDDVLSEALAEFVHNLTFDSRLVEGLQ